MESFEVQASLDRFIHACQTIQPERPEDVRRFFEGVVGFPYDKELLLQSFVYLNIAQYLPTCDRLLLFEKSPDLGNRTDLGKCDFVYLTTQQTLFLIETKYIDLAAHGTTAQRRRTKKRKDVIEQVGRLKAFLSENWNIPIDRFESAVFTTDPSLVSRGSESGILTEFVSIDDLFAWKAQYRSNLGFS
ncbi:hypothetical protein [Altericista sp. CCNU0014]|uniref:hypothetical protein n=1 Tax=Altericista sp. CCNU0014 TaxID=3082949 RepID=UPI00384B1471